MEEVRALSLREVGVGEPASGPNYAARERDRAGHGRDGNSERRNREERGHRRGHRRDGSGSLTVSAVPRDSSSHSRSGAGTRQVEHQSSLRDLLSAHELDSGELQEIMRQIMEGGFLDGIDLDHIGIAQEDEISERIAEAYRQRQRQREQARQNPPSAQHSGSRTHTRSRSAALQSGDESSRPSPRAHLEVTSNNDGRRRGASTNRRSNTSPHPRSSPGSRSSADLPRPTGRSSTDLSDHRQSEAPPAVSAASGRQRRSSTDPDRRRRTEHARRDISEENRDLRARPGSSDSPRANPTPETSTPTDGSQRPIRARTQQPPHQTLHVQDSQRSRAGPRQKANSSNVADSGLSQPPNTVAPHPVLHKEPSISCDRCGKAHIEYSLHYNCSKCNGGNYNICLSCFRLGKGCLYWYGFGHAARSKYLRVALAEGYGREHPQPHKLTGQRYLPPKHDLLSQTHQGIEPPLLATEDLSKRLQRGVFCDICFSLANECYWKCDLCNEGEWGFCNSCVNKGQCCTHPILYTQYNPTARIEPSQEQSATSTTEKDTPPSVPPQGALTTSEDGLLVPPMFTTRCNLCKLSIQPSHTRFHCPKCRDGNYDICTKCYLGLSASGRISQENGQNGWRRCPRGHRMIIVGFEDRDGEQRRVVVKDLVGGVALDEGNVGGSAEGSSAPDSDRVYTWKEPDGRVGSRTITKRMTAGTLSSAAPITTQFPPSGGVGMRMFAAWSYFPVDSDEHDLLFPRGAEIREAENMNEDWFWGCYAGSKGMFPAQHVKLL
jgi:Zn finger protein HypA/HybF involved in hydrogenase expression